MGNLTDKGFWAKAYGGRMNHFWLFNHNGRPLCQPNRKREMVPHSSRTRPWYWAHGNCERCEKILTTTPPHAEKE